MYIDVSGESELNPTTVLPLLCESNKRDLPILLNKNINATVRNILQDGVISKNVPFLKLPFSSKESQKRQLSDKISQKINPLYGGGYTLRYIFSELIYNIYSHTPLIKNLLRKDMHMLRSILIMFWIFVLWMMACPSR